MLCKQVLYACRYFGMVNTSYVYEAPMRHSPYVKSRDVHIHCISRSKHLTLITRVTAVLSHVRSEWLTRDALYSGVPQSVEIPPNVVNDQYSTAGPVCLPSCPDRLSPLFRMKQWLFLCVVKAVRTWSSARLQFYKNLSTRTTLITSHRLITKLHTNRLTDWLSHWRCLC